MKTNEQFLKDFLIKGNQNLQICEKYRGCEVPILVRCKVCGLTSKITPHNLLKHAGCGYCSGRKLNKEFNSFGAKHPELLKFFIDKNEAFKYTYGSKVKAKLQCPICQNKFQLPYYILNKQGFNCSFCNTMTYPNKFLRILLSNLPGITNLSFEKSYKINNKIIRYDSFFNYNDKDFIIEINGGQHYKNCSYNQFNVNNQIQKDLFKKQFAQQNNMIYIEIDARKSSFSYIKEQFLNSNLNNYKLLDNVCWNELFIKFNDFSLLKSICQDYEDKLLRVNELSQKYNINRHRISQILQDGKELNLCPSYKLNNNRQGVRIEAYNAKHELIGSYPSIELCTKKLNQKYNLNFLSNSISHVIRGVQKSHRNFYFKKVIYNE